MGPDGESRLRTAREKGFDLLVTGRVLYLFEGTSQLPSRVDEEIKVIEAATGRILFYAEAREDDPPYIQSDLIIVLIQGRNAPSTMALMERNAQKFSRLLGSLRNQEIEGCKDDERYDPDLLGAPFNPSPTRR